MALFNGKFSSLSKPLCASLAESKCTWSTSVGEFLFSRFNVTHGKRPLKLCSCIKQCTDHLCKLQQNRKLYDRQHDRLTESRTRDVVLMV